MNRAYVQDRTDKLVSPSHVAAEGLRLLGYEVIWFKLDDFHKLPLARDTLVVGWIETYRSALERVGVPKPPILNYPGPLSRWLGRGVVLSTLGDIRGDPARWPVFIKPAADIKSFGGRLVRGVLDLCPGLPNGTPVFASEPVAFKSEFRCFVQKGEVVGCRHYKGDPIIFPSGRRIREMVKDWADAPAAYCLDVGIVDYYPRVNETVLVEVNDGHSAGDYGLDPLFYARFLEARWCELTGASPIP